MSRRHRRAHLQPPGSAPPAAAGPATGLEPAMLAGVLEDHHYEQACSSSSSSSSTTTSRCAACRSACLPRRRLPALLRSDGSSLLAHH
eukprot:scaffold59968_cov22-Phaeocystis_antarctica.AAC.1